MKKGNMGIYRFTQVMLIIGIIFAFSYQAVFAEEVEPTAMVYFTGVGCPHCAAVDTVVLDDWLEKYPCLIVVEYEIYQERQNAILLDYYDQNYHSGLGVPLVIFNQSASLIGDSPIIDSFDKMLQDNRGNPLPLYDGSQAAFDDLDVNLLPMYPKIWRDNKIAIKINADSKDPENTNILIKQFLTAEDINDVFNTEMVEAVDPQPVQLSGSQIIFENAAELDNWLIQWDGPAVQMGQGQAASTSGTQSGSTSQGGFERTDISLTKTISLAAVDAVNPCALAVLTMMLIAIITYNPKKRENILLSGLAFAASVFIMYLFYGLVIIRFFQLVQAITNVRLVLYKVLAVAAIILGILQIKDFVSYKVGSFGTEMPVFLRPKVQKIISGITSPTGAFGVGLFVTLFLLPCTIGPYIILGGMLSIGEILKSVPYLLIYNLIFILPMLLITGLVYLGVGTVEDVSEWKDRNVKYLHLIAGVIILGLGIAMFFGWV